MDALNYLIEGKIDFKGQHLADQLSQMILIISAIVAFLVGYIAQNLLYTVYVFGAAAAATLIICVPPWPYFRQNPVKWLPVETSKSK